MREDLRGLLAIFEKYKSILYLIAMLLVTGIGIVVIYFALKFAYYRANKIISYLISIITFL
ncbi:MAG TPA: hypothetical protein DIW17_06960 [Clostridiales bacterium]|jgi:hypothetical protein|nr:hypothetical protein [Clostridia bacterium]HCS73596.1 hypothetical protein [Clostridiales bacterium]